MRKNLLIVLLTLACMFLGREAQSQNYQVSGMKVLDGSYELREGQQLFSKIYYVSGDSLRWSDRWINTQTGVYCVMQDDTLTLKFGELKDSKGQFIMKNGVFNGYNISEKNNQSVRIIPDDGPSKVRIGTLITQGTKKELRWTIFDDGSIESIGFEGYFYRKNSMSIISYFLTNKDWDVIEDGHINIIDPIIGSGQYSTLQGFKEKIIIKKYP